MRHKRILGLLAIGCLLVALTAGAAHRHDRFGNDLSSDGAAGSTDCAVCMLAHAPSMPAAAPVGLPADDDAIPLAAVDGPSSEDYVLDRAPGSRAPPVSRQA